MQLLSSYFVVTLSSVLLIQFLGLVNGSIYKDCGSVTGSIVDVSVTGCTQTPCVFVRGQSYTIQVNFTSNVNTRSAKNQVYGVLAGVPIPFHLPNEDGCSLGVNCPIAPGSSQSESVTMPVLAEYPRIKLYVKWIVSDDQNKQLICFLFPVSLV